MPKVFITKTCLYSFDPIKPHSYIVKLGFTGYTLFFIFLLKNIDCGYSLEPPRRGGSNEYTQSMFSAEIWKISEFFIWNFSFVFFFFVVKSSVYLNRHVFVMIYTQTDDVTGTLWPQPPRIIWASTSENLSSDKCAPRRFRSDCACAQSDQNLHWAHFG